MVKAKAKAERAAARQAQHVQLYAFAGVSTPSSSTTATPAPASGTATPTPADSPHEADEPPNTTTKESPPDRTEMLRGKPEVVGRFMQLIVPILVDVYAASVITTVRIKTLTGLLKAISYLEADEIKRVLTVSVCLLDARVFRSQVLSPYLLPVFLHPFYHPRTTPPSSSALCNLSSCCCPRSPRNIGLRSDGKVSSMKSSCSPTAHLSPRRRRAIVAIKKRTRTFPMRLRHLTYPHHPSPSHLQLPPVSQATRNYHHSL